MTKGKIGWQSIETAPTDGTIVLLTRKGSLTVCSGHYRQRRPLMDERMWVGCIIKEPTHWRLMLEEPE